MHLVTYHQLDSRHSSDAQIDYPIGMHFSSANIADGCTNEFKHSQKERSLEVKYG